MVNKVLIFVPLHRILFIAMTDKATDIMYHTSGENPTTPDQLFEIIGKLNIAYQRHDHPPVFSVQDGIEIEKNIAGLHCRNLFLRDKKEKTFLVVAGNYTAVDLKKLEKLLDCGRLSFGSPERLWRVLGVRPGSVCPYAVVNDREKIVTVILDKYMMEQPLINHHPLINTMTIGVHPSGLMTFIESCGHKPHVLDLSLVAPDMKEA